MKKSFTFKYLQKMVSNKYVDVGYLQQYFSRLSDRYEMNK